MIPVDIVVTEAATAQTGARLWPLYRSVFGDYAGFDAWRDAVWDRHRDREGFRLACAHRCSAPASATAP